MPALYFSHPESDRNTSLHTEWLDALPYVGSGSWTVVNPPSAPTDDTVSRAVHCAALAFLPAVDESLDARTFEEVSRFREKNPSAPLFALSRDGIGVHVVREWPGPFKTFSHHAHAVPAPTSRARTSP